MQMTVNIVEFRFESLTENVIFHFNRYSVTDPRESVDSKKKCKSRVSLPIHFIRMKSEKAI